MTRSNILSLCSLFYLKKKRVHADVLYLFFFCFFFKKYRIENIESCYKYCNMYCIVRGAYRFSPNEIKELKEGRKSHNHLFGSDTVSQLLFVCEKLLQGSREPHCHEYFSPRTNVCHIYL